MNAYKIEKGILYQNITGTWVGLTHVTKILDSWDEKIPEGSDLNTYVQAYWAQEHKKENEIKGFYDHCTGIQCNPM